MHIVSVAWDGFKYHQSKPCTNCCKTMIDFGVKTITYFDGEKWIKETLYETIKTSKYSSGDRLGGF